MNEFVQVDSWFEQKYKANSSERYFTFKVALNLFLQNAGQTIVETGTTRLVDDWGAGMSTLLFADVANNYGGNVTTVDILPEAMEQCKIVTAEFRDVINYVVDDSLHFLENYTGPKIDLLYLDSLDYPLGGDPTECQEFQLKEFKLIEKELSPRCVVLLDDNSLPGGGKTKLTKEYLVSKWWICVLDYQQSVFIRR